MPYLEMKILSRILKALGWWEPGEAGAARSKEMGRAEGFSQGSRSSCEGPVCIPHPSCAPRQSRGTSEVASHMEAAAEATEGTAGLQPPSHGPAGLGQHESVVATVSSPK